MGVVVMNVTSIATLASIYENGNAADAKRVTVDGSAVAEPKNVKVLIGTPIKEIIEFCGGYKETPAKLLCGGPMMGTALARMNFR